jgi:hypothetical protein
VTPDTREGLIDSDARQPGRESCGAVELAQVREGVDIRLLHDILGFLLVPEDGPRRAVDALIVAAHQQLERTGVAVEHVLNDLLVRLVGTLADGGSARRIGHRGLHSIE